MTVDRFSHSARVPDTIRKHATSIAYLDPSVSQHRISLVRPASTGGLTQACSPHPREERKMTASRTSSATHLQLNNKPKFKAGVPPTLSRRARHVGSRVFSYTRLQEGFGV